MTFRVAVSQLTMCVCFLQAIRPDDVYRLAMRQLRTSADVAAALGRPLQDTELRAFVMSGGRLRVKNFVPGYSTRRCHLLFPVQARPRGLHRPGVPVFTVSVSPERSFASPLLRIIHLMFARLSRSFF